MSRVAAEKKDQKPVVKPKADPMNEQTDKWFAELESVLSPFCPSGWGNEKFGERDA